MLFVNGLKTDTHANFIFDVFNMFWLHYSDDGYCLKKSSFLTEKLHCVGPKLPLVHSDPSTCRQLDSSLFSHPIWHLAQNCLAGFVALLMFGV